MILIVFRNLLMFGFYQDPVELGSNNPKNLLVGLLQLLNGCFDVTTVKEDEYFSD